MPEENLTVKLRTPVTVSDGTSFDELTMRELSVDETIALERKNGTAGSIEQDKEFFAVVCGVPPEAIGKLGLRDWNRVKNRYWATLGKYEPEQTN